MQDGQLNKYLHIPISTSVKWLVISSTDSFQTEISREIWGQGSCTKRGRDQYMWVGPQEVNQRTNDKPGEQKTSKSSLCPGSQWTVWWRWKTQDIWNNDLIYWSLFYRHIKFPQYSFGQFADWCCHSSALIYKAWLPTRKGLVLGTIVSPQRCNSSRLRMPPFLHTVPLQMESSEAVNKEGPCWETRMSFIRWGNSPDTQDQKHMRKTQTMQWKP